MKRKLFIALINILVTALFFFSLNLISNVILLISRVVKSPPSNQRNISESIVKRAKLPNYEKNRDLAKQHFKEFNELKSQYEAFIGWSRKPYKGKTITVDSNGDRVHPSKNSQDSAQRSIYFFGGSTMWGTGVTDRATIPAVFNLLSGIPSYNKGESGYISRLQTTHRNARERQWM